MYIVKKQMTVNKIKLRRKGLSCLEAFNYPPYPYFKSDRQTLLINVIPNNKLSSDLKIPNFHSVPNRLPMPDNFSSDTT